jgi:transposase
LKQKVFFVDRASHFFVTPKAGEPVDKQALRQVGRALRELGIQLIPAYSPQARGRSERAFRTWQGRLPQELRIRSIDTREAANEVRWRHGKETMRAAVSIESLYDVEAKYSRKDVTKWTGYKVHLSETCDDRLPHLITNVHTTVATTQDVASTADIQEMLYQKGLAPSRHLVDAGYVDGDLLVESADKYGIELFGPTRVNSSWQSREGGIDATQFEVDWDNRKVLCPADKRSVAWLECQTKKPYSRRVAKIKFKRKDCFDCENRIRCVRRKTDAPRQLLLQAREFHEALKETRAIFSSETGRREYQQRAGIEGTLSQGIRRGAVRRSRYIGLQKTHLQEVATAAGINILRSINFLHDKPIAKTRVSRFARLAH